MRFNGGKTLLSRLLIGFVCALWLGRCTVLAAPSFPDVPDMWASDAVRALAAKGLLEGYPDGTFKGDRAATRYEVAMIVARLLAKMEQEHATFATKADLDDLRRLVNQLREELSSLGVRVQNLEDNVAKLDKRVTELERITFYGNFHAIGVTQHLAGTPFIGTTLNPAIDFTNGRLLFDGEGGSMRTLLGAKIKLNEDMLAGIEFMDYIAAGNTLVNQYWGVTPPYNSNPFLSQGSLTPGEQPNNNQPFNRMTFDRFWLQDFPNNWELSLGSFEFKTLPNQIAMGILNPNINFPPVLPFWGFQFGSLDNSYENHPYTYEFDFSRLPNGSLYNTWMGDAAFGWNFGRGKIGVSSLFMEQSLFNDGLSTGAGATALPLANGTPVTWLDKRTGSLFGVVGPQTQWDVGVNGDVNLYKDKLILRAAFGHTEYDPDKTHTLYNTTVGGTMYDAQLEGHAGQFSASLDYMHVDPTYDPMVLPYGTNPNIPVFMPYGNFYSNYYQLHDYLQYPDNRQGPRLAIKWETPNTNIWARGSWLDQIHATTFGQFSSVGTIEPIFPVLVTPGVAPIGHIDSYGVGGYHRFDVGVHVDGSFWNYDIRRGGPAADNVDLKENLYRLNVGYPVLDNLDVSANYTYFRYRGHADFLTNDFGQGIPGLTVDYQLARNTSVLLNARLFNYKDHLGTGLDWRGNQVSLDINVDY